MPPPELDAHEHLTPQQVGEEWFAGKRVLQDVQPLWVSDSSFTDKLSRTPTRRRQRMLGSATVARRFFAVFMAG